MDKNSDPVQKFFLCGGWGKPCPQLKFFKLLEVSETSGARELILGLPIHINKANSGGYDVTR